MVSAHAGPWGGHNRIIGGTDHSMCKCRGRYSPIGLPSPHPGHSEWRNGWVSKAVARDGCGMRKRPHRLPARAWWGYPGRAILVGLHLRGSYCRGAYKANTPISSDTMANTPVQLYPGSICSQEVNRVRVGPESRSGVRESNPLTYFGLPLPLHTAAADCIRPRPVGATVATHANN